MKNLKKLTLSLVAVLAVSCMEVNAMHRTVATMARKVAKSGMGAFEKARIKEMNDFNKAYRDRTKEMNDFNFAYKDRTSESAVTGSILVCFILPLCALINSRNNK